ncbi:hypothetical protein PTSG_12656 [Salpingoeca rosetta]|uniref:Uncharacterized protein n=1 Tax=Salpingoeca rosetta (strain ATCC 50818 / BSB-021) TaxID=946362 RepID=F2UGR6_SALR5|nr:uncharacterized protein PTSG_12656 [Salpingoeca rosetta]EGD75816.1 hypothetical protein PTSG_12656 [Salpingoeca rosetta]|eukprot:XP_004991737.1 hypothetical protein PTSG_12656 [Salpingoeca rosetta]
MKEYKEEGEAHTKEQVSQLLSSSEYKAWHQTCTTCGACWFQQHWSPGCEECGGFAMLRPCPICEGRCGAIWKRSVAMSKSNKSAFWDGECGLSPEQQQLLLLRMEEGDVSDVVDMMEDVSTARP